MPSATEHGSAPVSALPRDGSCKDVGRPNFVFFSTLPSFWAWSKRWGYDGEYVVLYVLSCFVKYVSLHINIEIV